MLQLDKISKSYTTAGFTQMALDEVSISFRDNEFVAVLGPSGSGKTTMLNIVGGLDHYDSGNLVIDGISTEQYKDRDWDTYRNNRIGFVFQSYNLIPHQTVLANVELALTLSGVSRAERRERAKQALIDVDLVDHIYKKPSQLSGGQMQRVAIARALINDPEILLADEPTGALDTKTSRDVMALLTDIAKDRLVIMVTHNPELAERYATRTVNLRDGRVTKDSNPFDPATTDSHTSQKSVRKTVMSFFTALSLSFNNLMTKKGRTIMTAFAGSIGIIGIAAILALANGVNNYIKTVEEETLAEYPLSIYDSGIDMSSLLTGMVGGPDTDDSEDPDNGGGSGGGSEASNSRDADNPEDAAITKVSTAATDDSGDSATARSDGDSDSRSNGDSSNPDSSSGGDSNSSSGGDAKEVNESKTITRMFEGIGANDLAALKAYLDGGKAGIDKDVNMIQYAYDVTPQIYRLDKDGSVRQVNPDKTFSALGMGSSLSSNSLVSASSSTDMFGEIIDDYAMLDTQYDMLAGHWPKGHDELVVVLNRSGNISDLALYSMGLRDSTELDEMVKTLANNEEVKTPEDSLSLSYKDILGVSFKLIPAVDLYQYDEEFKVWKDKSDSEEFMKSLMDEGFELKIAGIVKPKPDITALSLSGGIGYTPALIDYLMDEAADSRIVKDQLENPERNVITGRLFSEEKEEETEAFDMNSLFSIDEEAINKAFAIDTSAMNLDLSSFNFDASSLDLDLSSLDLDLSDLADQDVPEMSTDDLQKVLADSVSVPQKDVEKLTNDVLALYTAWARSQFDPTNPTEVPGFADFLNDEKEAAKVNKLLDAFIEDSGIEKQVGKALQSYFGGIMQTYMQTLTKEMETRISTLMTTAVTQATTQVLGQATAQMTQAVTGLYENMASLMPSNPGGVIKDSIQVKMTEEDLTELMMSYMNAEENSYDNNLKKLGYATLEDPSEIHIYPIDFASKERVVTVLDAYNDRMETEDEDKVITYTDFVGTLMSSVTDIVNMVSYVLVAFVAISLVVSSIMIGVITYISVLERKKEIGILRSIGASKRDIGNVFNAETLIVGFVAGLLGILVTVLITIPVNIYVDATFNVPNVALLPWQAAAVLILISMFLTFLAGLIPSSAASRKDPVEALRSE